MARMILPQDRGSADPCAEPDDLLALAAQLIEDEGLTPFEAQTQALALRDDLDTFAAVWDAWASVAGHPTAIPVRQLDDEVLDPLPSMPLVLPTPALVK